VTPPVRPISDSEAVRRAADLVKAGALIIIPTDTIYGIATTAAEDEAIRRLYEARDRELEPASPFLISEPDVMSELARTNPYADKLVRCFWPGALTILLPPAAKLSQSLRRHPVALRMPQFPPLIPLLDAVGGHLFTSGAIRAGHPPAITAREASLLFDENVALILDGGLAVYGVPSTIVDCIQDPPVVIRRGPISDAKIWDALDLDAQ
jgi:L-threonylcarbamoyladenylate synthase